MAQNEYGIGAPAEIKEPVKIAQEPGPVQKFEISQITKKSALLTWEKPASEGGLRISGYDVETLQDKDSDEWKNFATVRNLSYKVKDITFIYLLQYQACSLDNRFARK